MAQIATTIRMDSTLKKEFDRMCELFGMSVNTAFNIFAKTVVRTKSIPFKIEADPDEVADLGIEAFRKLRQEAQYLPDMSLAQVNEEISEYRSSKHE